MAEIRPGVQTRAEVAELLGTPTMVETFGDERWYYITRRTETLAFFDPELIEQKVVVIAFDDRDRVAEVAYLDAAAARNVEPVPGESPVRGRELGILEQLFGNLSRPAVSR